MLALCCPLLVASMAAEQHTVVYSCFPSSSFGCHWCNCLFSLIYVFSFSPLSLHIHGGNNPFVSLLPHHVLTYIYIGTWVIVLKQNWKKSDLIVYFSATFRLNCDSTICQITIREMKASLSKLFAAIWVWLTNTFVCMGISFLTLNLSPWPPFIKA